MLLDEREGNTQIARLHRQDKILYSLKSTGGRCAQTTCLMMRQGYLTICISSFIRVAFFIVPVAVSLVCVAVFIVDISIYLIVARLGLPLGGI